MFPALCLRISIIALAALVLAGRTPQEKQSHAISERQAASAVDSALSDYQAGKLYQAVARLRQALVLSPGNAQIRLYLGLFLYEQDKDSAEAQRYMESVAGDFPSNGELQLRLLDSYLRARDEARSEALLQRLQSRMATDARFAFNVIYTLISHGRTVSARTEVDKVSNSLQGEILFIGGLIELGSDDTRALKLFDSAADRGFPPRESRQMLTLADSCFKLRAFPQAARAYEAFFANHRDGTPEQHFHLGLSYYGYGDFQRALKQMRQVKQASPDTPEVDLYIASILIETKELEEARPFLDSALKRDSASFKAMTKIAYLEYMAGNNELCRHWLEKALALNPQWFESHMVSGLLQIRLGQYEDAVRSLETCIREEPEYPKAYFQLSNAWRRLGNEEKAGQYLDRFNQLQNAAEDRVRKARGMGGKTREP